MTLPTRGSITINKAQRRLASLKSIHENLDLGYGLTIAAYTQLIEATRAAMEAHNTLVSQIDESRRNLTAMERSLSDLSSRMLSGVAIKYGKTSNEYLKAGGTLRKSGKPSSHPTPLLASPTLPTKAATNGSTNGKVEVSL